jgi:hypothetical protein
VVAVAVGIANDAGVTITCKLDPSGANTTMTALGSIVHSGAGTAGFIAMFGLPNTSSGAHTITATVAGGTPVQMEGGSTSFTGADLVTAFGTPQTAAAQGVTNPTITHTGSTAGNMITAGCAFGQPLNSVSAGTSRWIRNVGTSNAAGNGGQADKAAGGSQAITWAGSASDWFAISAVEVLAAASGPAETSAPPPVWVSGRRSFPPPFLSAPLTYWTRPARPVFDLADWLWNPIPTSPVLHANSAAIVTAIAAGSHVAGLYDYGVALRGPTEITTATPTYDVTFANVPAWGPDPFPNNMPYPAGVDLALAAPPTGDRHYAVADPTTDKVYSTWQTEFTGSAVNATFGGLADLHGVGLESAGSSTATNISRYGAVVREEEIHTGNIPHAMFFSSSLASSSHQFPAIKSDGVATGSSSIPEGARVQLDPTIDLAAISGITRAELAIGRALQTYGAYCGDKGGAAFAIICEFPDNGSTAVYSAAGMTYDYYDMPHLPWSSLQVLAAWDGGAAPAVLKQNTAEGGTNTTTVTTGNSGGASGDAFDAVSIGASNGLTFTSTTPWAGSLSYAFVKASTNQNFVGWTWAGAQSDFAFRIGFRFPAGNLAADEPIIRLFSGAGYTPQVAGFQLLAGATRKIRVNNSLTGGNVDSTASLSLDTEYVAVGRWISGFTLTVDVYAKGSTTVVATVTIPASTASVNSVRLGLTGSSNSAVTLLVDDLGLGYGTAMSRTDLVAGGVAVVGQGAVGLSSTSTVKKVAVVTARSAVGLGSQVSAVKKLPVTALGNLGLASQVTAKKAAPASAVGILGIATAAAARKVRAATASGWLGVGSQIAASKVSRPSLSGAVGVASSVSAKKVSTPVTNGAVGLAGISAARKVSTPSVRAAFGVAATVSAKKSATATGIASFGVSSSISRTAARAVTALSSFGLAGIATAKKVTTAALSAPVGLAGTVAARKVTPTVARGTVGISGSVAAQKRATAAGAGAVGFTSWLIRVPGRLVTAISSVGFSSTSSATKRATPQTTGALGLAGTVSAKKRSTPTATGSLGLVSSVTVSKKSTGSTARANIGIVGVVTASKRQGITGRSAFGVTSSVTYFRIPPSTDGYATVGTALSGPLALSGTGLKGPEATQGTALPGALATTGTSAGGPYARTGTATTGPQAGRGT